MMSGLLLALLLSGLGYCQPVPTLPVAAEATSDVPQASDARLRWYQKKVAKDLDPYAAELLLGDSVFLAESKSDRTGPWTALFARAAGLKDLKDTVLSHADSGSLREAVAARLEDKAGAEPPLGQGARPFVDWTKRYLGPEAEQRTAEAVWEWNALAAPLRDWLHSQGADRSSWDRLPFVQRQKLLAKRGEAVAKQALAAAPKTRSELDALWARVNPILGTLDSEKRSAVQEHMEKAEVSVESMQSLFSQHASVLQDPKLKALVAGAKNARSLDDRLARLAQLFDGAGIRSEELTRFRPEKPDEKLSGLGATQKKALEERLRKALLDEVTGTTPGDALQAFYSTHALKLKIKDFGTGTAIAQYDPSDDVMSFNSKFIQEWLKTTGRKTGDLMNAANPAAFRELVMLMSSTFVHEATHHRQKAWHEEKNVPSWYSHHMEIEAMFTESLYVRQKAAKSKEYREFLQKAQDQGTPSLAKGDYQRAQELFESPEALRVKIATQHYPNLLSLEGCAAQEAAPHAREMKAIEDQLAGRAPRKAGRAKLQKRLDELKHAQAQVLEHYRSIRDRHEQLVGEVTGSLASGEEETL
ncbi:MAG: hypothetical protein NTX64_02225 [Elusimicrobia bacterium]|nr:hypothetical protein [Elusimicrobiota bacterium]